MQYLNKLHFCVIPETFGVLNNYVPSERKGRDFREILGETVGGYPFFGQGERRNGVK
jgi:hypothetical protein